MNCTLNKLSLARLICGSDDNEVTVVFVVSLSVISHMNTERFLSPTSFEPDSVMEFGFKWNVGK